MEVSETYVVFVILVEIFESSKQGLKNPSFLLIRGKWSFLTVFWTFLVFDVERFI